MVGTTANQLNLLNGMNEVVRNSPSTWNDYRIRRALLLSVLIGSIPGAMFVSAVSDALLGPNRLMFPPGVLVWIIAYPIAGTWFSNFPCPRCGLPFSHSGWVYASPWTTSCIHCSWPKWREFNSVTDSQNTPKRWDGEKVQCLECGNDLPENCDICSACGWNCHEAEDGEAEHGNERGG